MVSVRHTESPGWGSWSEEQRPQPAAPGAPAAEELPAPLEEPVVPYEFRSTSRPIFTDPKAGRPAA